MDLTNNQDYLKTLESIKQQVTNAQFKAHLAVNKEMLILYWRIGKTILEKQEQQGWGAKVTRQLSEDLVIAFPNMKGFSYTNIRYMQRFASTYKELLICHQAGGKLENTVNNTICHQLGGKLEENYFINSKLTAIANIPWRHNTELLDKLSDNKQRLWYAEQTVENGWSRAVLNHQISTDLYSRQAPEQVKQHNFHATLPSAQSELANEIFKDKYNFDFIDNNNNLKERQLEAALVEKITKFLLELGSGFAFVGQQYHLEEGGQDFYIDLLFYHLELRSYIVIDLKTTDFKPEHVGKMGFYLAQVDRKLKKEIDNDSVGIILCPKVNKAIQQDCVSFMTKPVGVSGYELADKQQQKLPAVLKPLEKLQTLIEEHQLDEII